MRLYAGAWSFPGGKIDSGDFSDSERADWKMAARRAARREFCEETGLTLESGQLTPLARWLTPPEVAQRFTTWFFVTADGHGPLRINPSESSAHRWYGLSEALADHHAKAIWLPPPTYVTLQRLAPYATLAQLLAELRRRTPQLFRPRLVDVAGGDCFVYEEDSAYADLRLDRPGPRHRLWALESGWRYEAQFPESPA